MNEKELYRRDPSFTLWLTSRGNWGISATKHKKPAKSFADRYEAGHEFWEINRHTVTTIKRADVEREVTKALEWLYTDQAS